MTASWEKQNVILVDYDQMAVCEFLSDTLGCDLWHDEVEMEEGWVDH